MEGLFGFNKSYTRSITYLYLLFLKRQSDTLFVTTSTTVSKRWLPDKQQTTFKRAMIMRTLRKMPKIKDHVGRRLKPARQQWYHPPNLSLRIRSWSRGRGGDSLVEIPRNTLTLPSSCLSQGKNSHGQSNDIQQEWRQLDTCHDDRIETIIKHALPSLHSRFLHTIRKEEHLAPTPYRTGLIGDQMNRPNWSKTPAYPF